MLYLSSGMSFLSRLATVDMVRRTHLLEYSLVIVSVISIGHISTTALAAITLGSMTASVSGYSIIQGFTNALDTMLPAAWTSSTPQLVGLWVQKMSKFNMTDRYRGFVLRKSLTIDPFVQLSLCSQPLL
jgi:hypothetical protein